MRKRDENKERLIREKAIEIVVKEGFDGLSMGKLSKAANVSPATIYIYFEHRDDLLMSLYIEEFDKMAEATLNNFSPDMSFEDGLRIQWMNRAKYCLENSLSMHFLEQMKYSPYSEAALNKMDNNFRNVMGNFVRNAINRGEIVTLPLEVYWAIAFSPLYTLVKFHMAGRGLGGYGKFELKEEDLNKTLQLVLKALKP